MVNVPKFVGMVFQQMPGHCTLFHSFRSVLHHYRRRPYYIDMQPLSKYEGDLKLTNHHARKLDCVCVATSLAFLSCVHHFRVIHDLLIRGFSLIHPQVQPCLVVKV